MTTMDPSVIHVDGSRAEIIVSVGAVDARHVVGSMRIAVICSVARIACSSRSAAMV